ncbi:transposable element Tc3 transposase [Trichonephila clavipes]|nr:transposable element Tc3 transposase [Trichonephila clavipes]
MDVLRCSEPLRVRLSKPCSGTFASYYVYVSWKSSDDVYTRQNHGLNFAVKILDKKGRSRKMSISAERRGRADRKTNQEIKSYHWEVGGRPQCDKCSCRFRNCSQHRFTTLETISNYRNSYPGGSVVVVHEEPHPQMTGTLSYRPEETGGRQWEKSLDTRYRRLDDRYRVLPWPEGCTVVVCLHDALSEKAFSVVREHRNWRDNEWGRVLFTDENRFKLSSDSHRILIWKERESRNHPSNIIERDRYGGRGVLVWGGIMLGSRTDLHIFDAGSVNGTRYCNEILLPYVRLFRGAMRLQFLFMDDNAPCHHTVAAKQLLESQDIERRRLAARTLPPVTIRELRLALLDEWAAMPQHLIDTLILSMCRRCETCLAVRGDHIPY